jgi:hypothetical protein
MNDTPTLARFHMGWVEDGLGRDGLPLYREQLLITLDRPPLLRIERTATEDDKEDYPGPYAVFEKQRAAVDSEEGYPLVLWPACTSPMFMMLAARGISTVEGLAKLAGRGGKDDTMPAEIRELAGRAVKLMAMQRDIGKFEAIIREKDGELEALKEQVDEAVKTITAQKAVIDKLKIASVA